ncbi:MAG: tripartite tricarboxylate transporter substrate-binding protein [Acetobacteraceae bacterium]|nr:tripartite tricarboxylate transporter substrate-binding protein [Acetobacteraceae bacterium]
MTIRFGRRSVAAGLALAPLWARAQGALPQRPIRILVPFTPGGSPDVLARLLAEEFGRRSGQQAVAENRPGAGGNIAAEAVARAAPDGQTLLLLSNNIVAVNPHLGPVPFDPLNDFTPLALLARSPLAILVGPDSPARDIPGLLALARQRNGQLAYASAGVGSPHHLAMALLCAIGGVEMIHVPFRGTAPALTELVAGRVGVMASPVGTALPLIREGRVRPIAAAGARRLTDLPELPTVAEQALPGYETDTWLALVGPRGMPEPVARALSEAALATLARAETREQLLRLGIEPDAGTPGELSALIRRDHARWGEVIRRAGITAG